MKNISLRKISKYIVVLGFIAFSSCSEYLTIVPDNDLIKEKFWKTKEDVYSALGASYDALRSASLKSLIMGEVRADLITISGPDFTDYSRIAASNINPSNGAVNWKNYYEAINLANTLMYYDDEVAKQDITFTKKIQNAIEAEALFIRSEAFFYLVRLWKDVPLVLEPSISDTSNLFLPKSSEKVVVQQIIKDLLRAKDMAYTTEYQGTDNFYGRANKYSIMALLADVYLWNENYAECVKYCDEIINTGIWEIQSENWFNIYYPGNFPVESIIELQYNDQLENQENPIYDKLVTTAGVAQASVKTQNLSLLMTKEDLRNFSKKGPLWKYLGKDALGQIIRSNAERDANWILYRYSDIVLMKAEAEIELGNFEEANNLISLTASRANIDYIGTYDKDLLRQALLDERGREFLFEGKRWFDLLRAAKRDQFKNKKIIIDMIVAGADIKLQAVLRTKVYDTLSYYLPIPERDLLYNQNLKQNPYYDR